MLGYNLAINHKKVTSKQPTVFWILNTDLTAISGKNYVWIDTDTWADAQIWKDTGLGI